MSLNQTSYIYYEDKSDGQWKQLQRLYSTENRIWADHDEIPETLVKAAIAIEDKRFYQHQGVDWKRTISRFSEPLCRQRRLRRLDHHAAGHQEPLQ